MSMSTGSIGTQLSIEHAGAEVMNRTPGCFLAVVAVCFARVVRARAQINIQPTPATDGHG